MRAGLRADRGGPDGPAIFLGRAVRFLAGEAGTNQANPRTQTDIRAFFRGLDLIEPGLLPVAQWRPDQPVHEDPAKGWIIGGLARKPGRPL